MAVTLSADLPAIAFSKNPIWLKPQSDAYLAAAPAIAVNYQEFTAAVAADDTFTINWADGSVTMTAATSPDDSGNQFPTGDGGNTYVESLAPFFQQNFIIDEAFIVSSDITGLHPRLIFTARAAGAGYTFTGGPSSGNITPGADDTPVENFMIHAEVWIANLTGGFDQAYSANVPLDENPLTGISSIDISGVLDSWLTKPDEFDTPVLGALNAQYLSSLRAYFVKYAEFFGAVPAVQKVTTSGQFYIALGGLSMQNALLRHLTAEFWPVVGDHGQDRFMRQGSINKLVTKLQPEWLTYINLLAFPDDVRLEVIIYNDDSTSHLFYPFDYLTINAYQKFQFATGYTQLGIESRQTGKTPVYYTCRLKSDGYVTEAYAYVIDYVYHEFPRYFVYENGYGAFQTIATVGKQQAEYDRTKTDAQRALDRNAAAIAGDFIETNIYIQDKATVAIGYDRAGPRNTALLRDFMLSQRIYLANVADDGAITLIPIGLNTKNLKDALDGNSVYANSFEYYPKYQEKTYTEIKGLPDDSIASLIDEAGSPIPKTVPPILTDSGTIVVEFGDPHLSMDAGSQVYTAPFWLAGKTNYRVAATQLGEGDTAPFFRTADIIYNSGAGSFRIVVNGFVLVEGDQLIIFPFVLNPDS